MKETIEIDGDSWEVEESSEEFWIGTGTARPLRGCIVTARTREALIEAIPKARDQHEVASALLLAEGAIVAAFKSVLDQEMKSRHVTDERYRQLDKTWQLCAELWPWLFKDRG